MYSVPVSFTVPRGDDNVNYYEIRLGDDVKQGNLSRSDQGRTIEREFDLRLTAQKDVAATVTLYHRMPDGAIPPRRTRCPSRSRFPSARCFLSRRAMPC